MWPWLYIPVGLLALLPLTTATVQLPLSVTSPPEPVPTIESFTIIEALNNDSDYRSLIKLLQVSKLIPTLNKLTAATLFAPTNDAISRHAANNHLWQHALLEDTVQLQDNLHLRLRQQLFYHLLNYTLPHIPTEQTPQQHCTSLYPRDTAEPPSREPPPHPPWMPIPNGTLGTDPQRLRLSARHSALWAGVNSVGNGGIKIVKDLVNTSNGLVLGMDEVLEMPQDLATVVSQHPRLTYFHKILTPELTNFLNHTPTLTLFLPVDEAWDTLDPLERLYLESDFASDDMTRILNLHAVRLEDRRVKWSDSFESKVDLPTIDGPSLKIVPTDSKIKVLDAEIVERDIYASNGVLHTVSSLLLPPNALKLTPEKYLLALNCTEFVSLIHSVDLGHMINDMEATYTILAPRDDVIKVFGRDGLPHRGSEELRRFLQYHFIPGKWSPKKFENGMLVETALEEAGLGGGRQVMNVEVDEKKGSQAKAIRFAGAGVMGEQVEPNNTNTVIYLIAHPLTPPADVLETALPNLEYSSFIAAIFSTNLGEELKTTPKTTLLLPPNGAFKRLGLLVSNHLLSSSSKADLERVIRHHTLRGVEYGNALVNGSRRTFRTLEGSDIAVDRVGANRTVMFTPSGGWEDMQSGLVPKNTLTETGVIHQVTDIMIPRSVQLTVGKLVRAAKGTTMSTMLAKAGFEWVLNGTAPPEGTKWHDMGLGGTGWTLLCPTDDAFNSINLTELYSNEERLKDIVAQHLIPIPTNPTSLPAAGIINAFVSNRPLVFDDSATYTTLHSFSSAYGDIIVRVLDGGKEPATVVGIKGARGKDGEQEWARVVAWGRSTTGSGTGGVVAVDRLLLPYAPSWYAEYGAPIGVGGAGVVLIGMFFWGVRWVWRRDTTEATYEPVGGFGADDGEE